MNIKELKAKLDQYVKSATTALEEYSVLTATDGKEEEATQKFADYEGLKAKAESTRKQIDAVAELEGLALNDDEPDSSTKSAPNPARLPFSEPSTEGDDEHKTKSANGFENPVYVARYGTEDSAVKAIISDVYGADYANDRVAQQNAFNKYVRSGRVNRDEEKLLKTLILLPDQIKEDIRSDVSVHTIKSTLQESINELGGFLVPEDYRVDMVSRLKEQTIVRNRARVVTTNRDAVEFPKLEGGNDRYTSAVRVTWVDEVPSDENDAETNPTFGMIRVPVHTVMARTDVGKNNLEDSAFNMAALLSELFAEAAAVDEDTQFITGIGGGRPFGILGKRDGAEYLPADGIEVVNSGASSQLTADGVIDLAYALPAQYRARAAYLGARTTMRDIRKFKDTQNRYIWEENYQAGQPPTILGYGALESESVPTVAVNSHPLIYGDLSGFLVVDRVGMTIQRVEDATTMGRNKVAFFMRRRLGGQVIEPWKFKVQKVSA